MDIFWGIVEEIIARWLVYVAIAGGGAIMYMLRKMELAHRILYAFAGIASILLIWHVLIEPEIPQKIPSLEKVESSIRDWSLQAGYGVNRLSAKKGEQFRYRLEMKRKGFEIKYIDVILRDIPPERFIVIETRMSVSEKHSKLFNQLTEHEKLEFRALLEVELINIGVKYLSKIPETIVVWDKIFLDQMTNSGLFLEKVFLIIQAQTLTKRVFLLHLENEAAISKEHTLQESN